MNETLTFRDTQKLLLAIQQLYKLQALSSFGTMTLTIVNQRVESDMPQFAITR